MEYVFVLFFYFVLYSTRNGLCDRYKLLVISGNNSRLPDSLKKPSSKDKDEPFVLYLNASAKPSMTLVKRQPITELFTRIEQNLRQEFNDIHDLLYVDNDPNDFVVLIDMDERHEPQVTSHPVSNDVFEVANRKIAVIKCRPSKLTDPLAAGDFNLARWDATKFHRQKADLVLVIALGLDRDMLVGTDVNDDVDVLLDDELLFTADPKRKVDSIDNIIINKQQFVSVFVGNFRPIRKTTTVTSSSSTEEATPIPSTPEDSPPITTIDEEATPITSFPEDSPTDTTIDEEATPVTSFPEDSPPITTTDEEATPITSFPEDSPTDTTIAEEATLITSIPDDSPSITTIAEEATPISSIPDDSPPITTITEEASPITSIPEDSPSITASTEEEMPITSIPEDSLDITTIPGEFTTIHDDDDLAVVTLPHDSMSIISFPDDPLPVTNVPERPTPIVTFSDDWESITHDHERSDSNMTSDEEPEPSSGDDHYGGERVEILADLDNSCNKKECSFGNLITDAMTYYGKFNLTRNASIWSFYPIALYLDKIKKRIARGNLSVAAFDETVLPDTNIIQVCMLGSVIEFFLTNYYRKMPRIIQISGLRVTFVEDSELTATTMLCGKCPAPVFIALDAKKEYDVLINENLARKLNAVPDQDSTSVKIIDVVQTYLRMKKTILPGVEDRYELATDDRIFLKINYAVRSSNVPRTIVRFKDSASMAITVIVLWNE